jgi:hypothetical protein
MGLTSSEQDLLISMLENPLTKSAQKIYKNDKNFYISIWKFRDAELVKCIGEKEIGSKRKQKVWALKLDGIIVARILIKLNSIEKSGLGKKKYLPELPEK